MRKTLIASTLAIILSMLFSGTRQLITGRAWASSVRSSLLAQGGTTISINDAALTEGNSGTTNMVFTVTLTASGSHPTIGVNYSTANGPPPNGATAAVDYTSTSGLLVFPPGTGNATMPVSVPIIGDTNFEPDETFFVNVS